MAEYTAVRVDDENNAETWWAALGEAYPVLAASLRRNGCAVVAAPVWDALAALPGFGDGPAHAPTALIDCGGEGDRWADVVAGPHQVFELTPEQARTAEVIRAALARWQ